MSHENNVASKLNDKFRTTMVGGSYAFSAGIAKLGTEALAKILHKVRAYDDFTHVTDPYGYRDSGWLYHEGQRIFWRMDYFDPNDRWCANVDSTETMRVITVMLASEY